MELHPRKETEKSEASAVNMESRAIEQTAELLRVRQALRKMCTMDEMQYFLIANDSDIVEDKNDLLDRCADLLTFGALPKCTMCQNGDMIFTETGYTCNGVNENFLSCEHFELNPTRSVCNIPDDLMRKSLFADYKLTIGDRIIIDAKETQPGPSPGPAPPDSTWLALNTHVYVEAGVAFNCILGLTNMKTQEISFARLQVLETDLGIKKYWVNTSSEDSEGVSSASNLKHFGSSQSACEEFERVYYEYTSNEWQLRANFRRVPGMFYPILESKLPPKIEELMKQIFSINNMKLTLEKFELDVSKIDFRFLNDAKLRSAFEILNKLEEAASADVKDGDPISLANQFFALIPHKSTTDIFSLEAVQEKRKMMKSLVEIQRAYLMIELGNNLQSLNCFDAYYNQLKADIVPVDSSSEEYKMIETYVTNTQTRMSKICLQGVFKINRHGERERFSEFSKLHNRMLLWHGSLVANIANIIQQGLKLSVSRSGTFGRGLYFSDSVSKSAEYCKMGCFRNGMLLLCEVALGNVHEQGKMLARDRPPESHSVKGLGHFQPNPDEAFTRHDGVVIPLGKHLEVQDDQNNLKIRSYNEFVVYNEAQVNIQYLVQVKYGR